MYNTIAYWQYVISYNINLWCLPLQPTHSFIQETSTNLTYVVPCEQV